MDGTLLNVKSIYSFVVLLLLSFKSLVTKAQSLNYMGDDCHNITQKPLSNAYQANLNSVLSWLSSDAATSKDDEKKKQLDWKLRLNIINGIARGILYLHEDSRLRVIHRDLKASNVLLDHEMNPKISDFGLARAFEKGQNQANTKRVMGTYGYMAPEYAMEGLFSVKSDVFSFGVLVLEIICGKKNSGFYLSELRQSLLLYAWKIWCAGKYLELMDPVLENSCIDSEVVKCIHIGLLCVQEDAADRPTMSTVVVMLASDTMALPKPNQPAFSVGRMALGMNPRDAWVNYWERIFYDEKKKQLDWKLRLNIINGIARGILYLHEDSRLRVIHRDLKASNVLLDHEMNPKISDFGLARAFEKGQNQANTKRVMGTYGYMAPEYAMEGLFSVKSDVFSFGVLVLEIICGKKNSGFYLSECGQSLLLYAWKIWSAGKYLELMDPVLETSCIDSEVVKCIHIGLLCVQEDAADRPTMSTVVVMLASDTMALPKPNQPAFSVGRMALGDASTSKSSKNRSINDVTISNILPR
ncbi:Cysteine-rich receptor protein kinase 10 [Spatholobus suberectus]|nr:Cysteine-rich receptor protein kinase 10 [Spatholobus suberectus]